MRHCAMACPCPIRHHYVKKTGGAGAPPRWAGGYYDSNPYGIPSPANTTDLDLRMAGTETSFDLRDSPARHIDQ